MIIVLDIHTSVTVLHTTGGESICVCVSVREKEREDIRNCTTHNTGERKSESIFVIVRKKRREKKKDINTVHIHP